MALEGDLVSDAADRHVLDEQSLVGREHGGDCRGGGRRRDLFVGFVNDQLTLGGVVLLGGGGGDVRSAVRVRSLPFQSASAVEVEAGAVGAEVVVQREILVDEPIELERFGRLDEVRVALQGDARFADVDELQEEVDVLCREDETII